jgi:hypothetical protein
VPLTDHVALVSLTGDISLKNLLRVTAAVQKQLTRDFEPIWGVRATVNAFADLASVPSDYRPVVVFGDRIELAGRLEFAIGAEHAAALAAESDADRLQGLHLNAFTRQPFALVEASDAWSVTASHEILELLTNPGGNRLRAAAHPLNPSERVNYLLEVCGPCTAAWYPVNGIPVADFYTPRYFDPVHMPSARYSFTGEIEYPQQILEGGHLSWIDPRNSMLHLLRAGETESQLLFGREALARTGAPLRTLVDSHASTPSLAPDSFRPARSATASAGAYEAMLDASRGGALSTAEAVASLAAELG